LIQLTDTDPPTMDGPTAFVPTRPHATPQRTPTPTPTQAHAASTEAGIFTVNGGSWEVAYELIVLEQALRSFSNQFARIAELLSLIVETSLSALVDAGQGNEEQLFKLVPLKDGLAVAHANVQEVVDVIVQLLNSDEDMLNMMLTERSNVKGAWDVDVDGGGGGV
jgi:hypothetical protein